MQAEVQPYAARFAMIFPDYNLQHDQSCWSITLTKPDGSGLFIDLRERNKFKISGIWPHGEGNSYVPDKRPIIGLSRDRGNDDIRKQVERRLLPEYEPLYKQMVAKKEEDERTTIKRRAVVKEFCEMTHSAYDAERYPDRVFPRSKGISSVKVSHSGKEVSLELSYLPLDVARQVLALVERLAPDTD
jgi:hypothetical protein